MPVPATGDPDPEPNCRWLVTDTTGTQYFFGGVGSMDGDFARYYDLCQANPARFDLYYYQWDVAEIRDTHQNKITFGYDQQTVTDQPGGVCGTGQQPWVFSAYPDWIRYNNGLAEVDFQLGSNYTNSGMPPLSLRYDSPRNLNANDPPGCPELQHIGGAKIKVEETRFLNWIDVNVNDGNGLDRVRRYDFTYDTTWFHQTPNPDCEPTAGVHRLDEVRHLGRDLGELNTMTFAYWPDLEFGLYNSAGTIEPGFSFRRPFLWVANNGFGGFAAFGSNGLSTPQYVEKKHTPVTGSETHWSRRVVEKRVLDGASGAVEPIVTRYTYSQGSGSSFQGPAYKGVGAEEEFRGFAEVEEKHGALGGPADPYTLHKFYTTGGYDEWRTGREYETIVYSPTGVQWRRALNTWIVDGIDNCGGFGCAVNFARLATVQSWEGPGGAEAKTDYEYDLGGNVVVERHQGLVGQSLDEKTVWHKYHLPPDPRNPTFSSSEQWLFLPQFERLYQGIISTADLEANVGLFRERAFFYDGSTDFSVLPPNAKGELTGLRRDMFSVSNIYYVYWSNGNLRHESVPTDKAVTQYGTLPGDVGRTTTTYDSVQQAFPVTIENPMGHDTFFEWDLLLGHIDASVQCGDR